MSSLARNASLYSSSGSIQNQPDLDSRTVLIVDDHEETRYLIQGLLLREMKLNILLAQDGATAMRILSEEKVDLILLDHLMPSLSGFETLILIKAEERLREIPVLMFSALDSLESAARCIMRGADDFLIKPFDPDLLRVKAAALLEKKKLRDVKNDFTLHLEKANAELLRKVNQMDIALRETIFSNEELQRDRSRLVVLTEAAMEGLALHEQGIIIDCNHRFAKIFGIDPRAATGMSILDFVEEESREPLMKAINDGKERWALTVKGATGGRKPLEITGRFFAKDGSWLSTISVREIEPGATGANLPQWSGENGLSLVTQSVREPLATMASMINALETADLSAGVREQIVTRLRSTAESMVKTVDNLLDIGRVKSGRTSPRMAMANCWAMAEEILESHRVMANSAGVGLINQIPKGWNVMTDSQLLLEALGSLVSSAIRYTPSGGVVTVGMAKGAENLPSITVKDQSPGMDPAAFKLAVEGAACADVGLALAAHIMRALNGSLSCKNPEEGGSIFYLTFPRAAASALIITGDRFIAMKLSKAIEQAGVDVSLALSAEDALGILRVAEPEVVVADGFLAGSPVEAGELSRLLKKSGGPVVVSLVERPGEVTAGSPDYLEIPSSTATQTLPLLITGILGKR